MAGQQEQHQQQQQEAPIDYALYQSFWGLQERLSEPAKLLQGGPGWDDFVGKAKTVLQAFEGFTVSEDSVAASAAAAPPANKLRRAVSSASLGSVSGAASLEGSEPPQPSEQEEEEEEELEVEEDTAAGAEGKGGGKKKRSRAAMEGGGGDGGGGEEGEGAEKGAYLGCKYLTNSRLFRLQLHDPLVRVQVLTQVLIVLNYVQASQALTKAAAAASTPAASPTAAASASSSAARFKSALSATATAFTPGAGELRGHARRLIRAMPQHGPGYLKALDAVLDRERQWLAWKQVDKCATKIERPLPPGSGAKEVRARPEVKAALQAAAAPTLVVRQQRAAFFGQPLSLPRPVHLETIKKVCVCGGFVWGSGLGCVCVRGRERQPVLIDPSIHTKPLNAGGAQGRGPVLRVGDHPAGARGDGPGELHRRGVPPPARAGLLLARPPPGGDGAPRGAD